MRMIFAHSLATVPVMRKFRVGVNPGEPFAAFYLSSINKE